MRNQPKKKDRPWSLTLASLWALAYPGSPSAEPERLTLEKVEIFSRDQRVPQSRALIRCVKKTLPLCCCFEKFTVSASSDTEPQDCLPTSSSEDLRVSWGKVCRSQPCFRKTGPKLSSYTSSWRRSGLVI